MKLRLERIECVPAYTMGRLFVDGAFECWVLEDTVRAGKKIAGATAAKRAAATAPNAYELEDGGRYRKAADMLGIKTVYPSRDAGEWAKQNLGLMPEWERQQKKQKVKYTPKRRSRLGGLHGMSGDGLRGL